MHASDPADLDHRIAVSRDFGMLQGIITAGVGVSMLLAWVTGQPLVLTIGATIALAVGAGWYRRRYGTRRDSARTTAGAAALAVVFGVVLLIAVLADRFEPGPVLWTSVAAAVALAVSLPLGLRHVGMTPAHWVIIGLLAASTLLPLTGLSVGEWGALVPAGLALIAVGVLDHRRLVAALGDGAAE